MNTTTLEVVPGWAPPGLPGLQKRPWLLLLLGGVLIVMGALRWNVGALAWVAPVPLLVFLRLQPGWRARVALGVTVVLATNLQILKMITPPLSVWVAPMFGVPLGMGTVVLLLAWDVVRRRAGETWALYTFPALSALLEVVSYRTSEFGMWGTAAVSQLENLPLLQLAAVTGVSGIGFLMAWVASVLAWLASAPAPHRARHLLAPAVALVAAWTYGSVRLFSAQPGPTVTVAGVVTDVGPNAQGFPDAATLEENNTTLLERSQTAANRGAVLTVWNEGATLVTRDQEEALLARASNVARANRMDLVVAYVVPLGAQLRPFENKYVWLDGNGQVVETYFKHHPVPGEGSITGTAPLQVLQRPYGTAAGAICYDFDFPAMATAYANLGAGLVVVPSSDWQGIDPYHSQMTRIRAIEGGFSVLRPVRWATSVAYDAYGRQRAALPFFEDNNRVFTATLPVQRVETLYARLGDAPAAVYGVVLLGAVRASRRKRR